MNEPIYLIRKIKKNGKIQSFEDQDETERVRATFSSCFVKEHNAIIRGEFDSSQEYGKKALIMVTNGITQEFLGES